MITLRANRDYSVLYALLLFIFCVLVFIGAYQKQHWDTDIFWALKSGEWIFNNLDVPRFDPFSYTFPDKEWIDFTWGFQVVAHIFYTYLGGWIGLFILQVVLTYATFYLIYKNIALLTSKRLWFTLALLFLVYANARVRYIIRPQLFAYFFMAFYFYILTLFMKGERGKTLYIWALLPLQVFWVNFHSSFVLGIFIVGAYGAGEFIEERFSKGLLSKPSPRTVWLIIVALLLPVVSLINPYGYKLAFFPLIHMGGENADALRYIAEWTPVRLKEMLFYFYPYPLHHFSAKVIFFGVMLGFILNFRRLKLRDFIIIVPVAYMAASHIRWVVVFVFFAVPILARNLSDYMDRTGRVEGKRVSISMAISIIVALLFIYEYAFVYDRANVGIGLRQGYYPEGTVSFMKDNRLEGNIFNTYIFGGYLIYHYPKVKVFIDGRTPTVYSPYHFWTSRLVNKNEKWRRLQKDHGLDMALVGISQSMCAELWKDSEWVPVNFDDSSVLFLKDTGAKSEAIARWGFHHVDPCDTGKRYELPEDLEKLALMSAELKEYGYGWEKSARPYWLMGLIDTEIGTEESLLEAVKELTKAIELNRDPLIYYDVGLAYVKLKRYDEALRAFEKTIDFDSKFDRGYYGLGLAYYYKTDFVGAYKYFEKHIDMAGDKSEELAYKLIGLAAFNIKKFDKAAIYLKRAAFLNDEPKTLANIYYFLANSLLEEGKLLKSSSYYQLAIELEPEYRLVVKALADDFKARGRLKASEHLKSQIDDKN
ncbi:MAG: tetratricopeptide repeat protein [Thermodesulfobacteriota bacterium]